MPYFYLLVTVRMNRKDFKNAFTYQTHNILKKYQTGHSTDLLVQ